MVSMSERYPKKGFIKADDVQGGDLILQIATVSLGERIGSGKSGDVVRFGNDGRALILNYTNAHAIAALHGDDDRDWPSKWIALYLDPDVEYDGKREGGVRVRNFVPQPGNGSVQPQLQSTSKVMDDEIPF